MIKRVYKIGKKIQRKGRGEYNLHHYSYESIIMDLWLEPYELALSFTPISPMLGFAQWLPA
jgi:hypothetical protein